MVSANDWIKLGSWETLLEAPNQDPHARTTRSWFFDKALGITYTMGRKGQNC